MAARKWTFEQRKQHSLKINQWQPWTKLIGAKTIESKVISSQNAYKGGFRKAMNELRAELKRLQVDIYLI